MIGQTLKGRYFIEKSLGSGTFGKTYLAKDQHLPYHPYCVVKHFCPQVSNSEELEKARCLFDREAKTLYELNVLKSSQIPQLFAHFEENQEFFIVQEWIEGGDLAEQFKSQNSHGKKFTPEETKNLLKKILKALTNLHKKGIIHRDLKPSNIRIRAENQGIVLIDFGAVKQVNMTPSSQLTVIGTPGYLPPEQAKGHPELASDIYAVGMIGIEALCGVIPPLLPIDPNTKEPIWHDLVKVDDQFAKILEKMVNPNLSQRYANAQEALNALKLIQPKPSWKRGIIAFLVLLMMGGIGLGIKTVQDHHNNPNTPPEGGL